MRAIAIVVVAAISSVVGCSAPVAEPVHHSAKRAAAADDGTDEATAELPAPEATAAPTSGSRPVAISKAAQPDGTVLWSAGAYSAVVDDRGASVPEAVVADVVDVFFHTYGTMALRFDPSTPKRIEMTFDPGYDGVAATHVQEKSITFSSSYMTENPKDLDVVTHEGFHLVQSYAHYTEPGCPAWAVEGFADYARYRYGTRNAEGGWSLPDVTSEQKPTDSYRVTGRFFVWLENRVQPTIMAKLHETLKANTYSASFWSAQTTKSLDQLWSDYVGDPAIDVVTAKDCALAKHYCGGNVVFGAPDVLYTCNAGGTATELQKCTAGCSTTTSGNDACR